MNFWKISLLVWVVFSSGIRTGIAQETSTQRPPNIVILFMDDMGYGDLETYGGIRYKTPYSNQLAANGMRFTSFYVPEAACSASRAAILTGCYPNRIGVPPVFSPNSPTGLPLEEKTIAELLKKRGYKTAMYGKWHLGDHKKYLPLQQGFDSFLGIPYSADMWPVDYDGTKITDPNNRRIKYPPLPLIKNNSVVDTIETLEDQSMLTSLFTTKACSFMEEHRSTPFFLYMAYTMPHVPIAASPKFKGKSGAGVFGDVMEELDWSVGQINKKIKDLGLSKNTIVILTSDNGPWLNYGNHAGNTGGLREGKGTSWEGGVRVPAIIKWEGHIPRGTVCNEISSTIDLLPTIVKICGAELPTRKIDGVDISPLLLQRELPAPPRNSFAYYYHHNDLEAVRGKNWKLVFPHIYRTYKKNPPGWDGWPGAQPNDTTDLALFDLQIDPGETLDLKNKFPAKVDSLRILAEKYRKDMGDHLTAKPGPGRRVEKKTK